MATVGGRLLFRCLKIYNFRGFERRLFTKNNVNQLDLFLKSNRRLYSIESFVNDIKIPNDIATFTFVSTYGIFVVGLFWGVVLFWKRPTSRDDETGGTETDSRLPAAIKNSRLFAAIKDGEFDVVKGFLHAGADVNARHPLGWTALQLAAVNGNIDAVKQLLAAGADPNLQDEFSHHNQVAREKKLIPQDVQKIRREEFNGRVQNSISFLGCTALHYAVIVDKMDIINELVQAGADPGITNVNEDTPDMCEITEDTKRQFQKSVVKYKKEQKAKAAEEKLKFPMELRLKEHIIGQEGAINTVASAIRGKESRWYGEEHPFVFLFLGSSGIGKTELAKQVAAYLHKNLKKGFIRLDMSEYQQKHEVSKFIGPPPGYEGYEQGGHFTNMLKANPKAVVLFDEVDKAHTDVVTIMLQLFDEGRLTDGKGKTIECKDAIFIMTSNLASDEICEHGQNLRHEAELVSKQKKTGTIDELDSDQIVTVSSQFKEDVVQPILKRHFKRDEFLGRINEIVYFLPFSRLELSQLVLKELNMSDKIATDKHGMRLIWDDQVVDVLTDGYNVHYGARSLKDEVKRKVANKLAEAHERQMIGKNCVIKLTVAENTQAVNQSSEKTGDHKEIIINTIKLQVWQKGQFCEPCVELDLKK